MTITMEVRKPEHWQQGNASTIVAVFFSKAINYAREKFSVDEPRNLWEYYLNTYFEEYVNDWRDTLPDEIQVQRNFTSNAADPHWANLSFFSSRSNCN